MAALAQAFDATQVQPAQTFEPLPSGDYTTIITYSDMKPTKRDTGQYLELELEVIDGNFKGRKIWDRLNLINQNPKAVEIAQRQLSALCHAAGVMNVTDSNQLHNIPVIAKVVYREANGQYSATNDVKGYSKAGGTVQVQPPSPAQPPPQAQQPAPQQAAPWSR